jgi:hypothetical protein
MVPLDAGDDAYRYALSDAGMQVVERKKGRFAACPVTHV